LVLPAANGTMSRIGFAGYCAFAGAPAMNIAAAASKAQRTIVFMGLLLDGLPSPVFAPGFSMPRSAV
jgi:hypothetical protein